MSHHLTRRQFAIASSTTVITGLSASTAFARQGQPAVVTAKPAAFSMGPPIDVDLGRQAVGESHRNLERVIELVTADQELVNAVWDWGGGDFETPLGAAAHTGQREIAEFLLKNGARMDVFAAAMLGKIDVVKAAIAADPMVQFTLGPHGITLMRHAEAGEDEAAEVMKYLQELEASDHEVRDLPLSKRAVKRYVGTFKEDNDGSATHEFIAIAEKLQWVRSGKPTVLAHRGNHEFAPNGSSTTPRLRFGIRNNQAVVVEFTEGGSTVKANRIE